MPKRKRLETTSFFTTHITLHSQCSQRIFLIKTPTRESWDKVHIKNAHLLSIICIPFQRVSCINCFDFQISPYQLIALAIPCGSIWLWWLLQIDINIINFLDNKRDLFIPHLEPKNGKNISRPWNCQIPSVSKFSDRFKIFFSKIF